MRYRKSEKRSQCSYALRQWDVLYGDNLEDDSEKVRQTRTHNAVPACAFSTNSGVCFNYSTTGSLCECWCHNTHTCCHLCEHIRMHTHTYAHGYTTYIGFLNIQIKYQRLLFSFQNYQLATFWRSFWLQVITFISNNHTPFYKTSEAWTEAPGSWWYKITITGQITAESY